MTMLRGRMLVAGFVALTVLAAGIIILGNQRQAHALQVVPPDLANQIVCLVYSDLNAFGSPIPVLSAEGCAATSTPSGGGTLEIIKTVSGTSTPSSDFTIHVLQSGISEIADSPQPGSSTGTSYIGLTPGVYSVSEASAAAGINLSDFTASFSGCPAGVAVVAVGQTTVCTITNTWKGSDNGGGGGPLTGTLVIKKVIVGGFATPSMFSFKINNGSAMAFNANGENDFTEPMGAYNVTEVATSTYTPSYSNCIAPVVTSGATTTCTITNTWNGGAVASSSDLSITKTVDNATPTDGTNLTYTITVHNAGPDAAMGVTVHDALPSGLTYVSDDGADAYDPATGVWTIGTVATTSDMVLHIVATVGDTTSTITNTATIASSNSSDNNSDNNSGSVSISPVSAGGGGGAGTGVLAIMKVFASGTTTPSMFSFSVNGGAPVFWNANGENDMNVTPGTYSVVETASSSYASAYSGCSELLVSAGATSTCTVTNSLVVSASSSDLSLVKTVDNNTPAVGGTVTYTLTVSNAGPAAATGVTVTDLLPEGVTYVSDDSATSSTTYDSVTGLWTIGTLGTTSTAVLNITATVNSGTGGDTITNSATVSDSNGDQNTSNNTGSTSITPPAPTNNNGGGGSPTGGGGGGNGPIVGSYGGGGNGPVPGQVLGASTSSLPIVPCNQFLTAFIQYGAKNDSSQVTRLQEFLNQFEGANLTVSGVYDLKTLAALKAFQAKYASDILVPWGSTAPTGFVYLTTRKEVNEIYCGFTKAFPLTPSQQAIITSYRTGHVADTNTGTKSSSTAGGTNTSVTTNSDAATASSNMDMATSSMNQSETGASPVTGSGFWSGISNFFKKLF